MGLFMVLPLFIAGCNSKSFMGGVEVKDKKIQPIASRPTGSVYVCNFKLDPSLIQIDPTGNGLGSSLLGGSNSGGILGRLRQRSQPEIHGSQAEQAQQIVDNLADEITQSLNKKKISATRMADCKQNPAGKGWMLRGEFLAVDEGNRAERAAIGFGEGATRMDVSVTVTDLGSGTETAPLASFDTTKDPGKKPGAVVTMNPYALAAKFHMEKNATAKDLQQTAEEIAGEVAGLATGSQKTK